MKEIICNICGSSDLKIIYKARDRMVRRNNKSVFFVCKCRRCGFVYLNPQPEWNELEYFYGGDYYTNDLNGTKKFFIWELLRRIKRKFFGAYRPKFWNFGQNSGKFLDIGCGNGNYESYFINDNQNWEFYGIEPSRFSYELAKNIKGFRVFNGNLSEANYNDNFFDVILMNHSLEHLPNPTDTLKEVYRILKPSGKLVIGVPNFNSLARVIFGSYWIHLDAPRHLCHFSEKTLNNMLRNNNFVIKELWYEVLTGSVSRSLAYLFGLEKFFFERPLIMMAIHYIIWPIDKIIEFLPLASGLRVIAIK